MTTFGQLTAKPPVSPHANLSMVARIGTTTSGSAIWSIACTCGAALKGNARAIQLGKAHCPSCNPRMGLALARKILPVLPATYAKIERKTKLSEGQVRYRIEWMREKGLCFIGGYERPPNQGAYLPIFHAGAGPDVPCSLKPRGRKAYEQRYKKRVKRAVEEALAGGKEDARYMLHIARRKADATVQKARQAPQTWLSALMPVSAGKSDCSRNAR